MTDAQIHLMANHLPLAIPFIGVVVLIISFFIKSAVARRIGYVILVLGGLLTIPAFLTGEGAEEIAEHMGKNHDLIHEHEESAETFAYLSYVLACISVTGLWMSWKKHELEKYVFPLVLAAGVLLAIFAVCTGESGGEISHPEMHTKK